MIAKRLQTLGFVKSRSRTPTLSARFKAGTLYPILIRLADRSWLETMWEKEIPGGRPVRHLYRLRKQD
jgi:DNA-binding PadR family transcriptional regulator